MADSKITALASIGTGTDPANDPLVIVDVSDVSPGGMSATGTTKKVTLNNLLSSSPTATGNFTITGDLTVRTNKLKVDATGVAIGATSASYLFDVRGTDATNVLFAGVSKGIRFTQSASTSAITGVDNTGGVSYQPLSIGGSALDFSLSGSTAMTLNATGLGVGVASPTQKLSIAGAVDFKSYVAHMDNFAVYAHTSDGTTISSFSGYPIGFRIANSEKMRIDTSGNVGIGVSPSAWNSGWSGGIIQFKNGTSVGNPQNGSGAFLGANVFRDASGNDVYISSDRATRYRQQAGQHQFFYDTGTQLAGANVSFTQAMTLSATGQLLLGTSSTNGAVDIGMVMNKPSATGFVGNVYQLNGVDKAFGYIASAASAYTIETVSGYIIRAVSATNGVYLPNGGTSWLALSDERFKDIIEPISNAVAKVGSLRSVIGKFKTESEGTRRSFLIAQDVQAVLPEAVDASNPEKLGVAYTEVIPLLVAAIKELTARVQTLETR